jgi:hypothetical protein
MIKKRLESHPSRHQDIRPALRADSQHADELSDIENDRHEMLPYRRASRRDTYQNAAHIDREDNGSIRYVTPTRRSVSRVRHASGDYQEVYNVPYGDLGHYSSDHARLYRQPRANVNIYNDQPSSARPPVRQYDSNYGVNYGDLPALPRQQKSPYIRRDGYEEHMPRTTYGRMVPKRAEFQAPEEYPYQAASRTERRPYLVSRQAVRASPYQQTSILQGSQSPKLERPSRIIYSEPRRTLRRETYLEESPVVRGRVPISRPLSRASPYERGTLSQGTNILTLDIEARYASAKPQRPANRQTYSSKVSPVNRKRQMQQTNYYGNKDYPQTEGATKKSRTVRRMSEHGSMSSPTIRRRQQVPEITKMKSHIKIEDSETDQSSGDEANVSMPLELFIADHLSEASDGDDDLITFEGPNAMQEENVRSSKSEVLFDMYEAAEKEKSASADKREQIKDAAAEEAVESTQFIQTLPTVDEELEVTTVSEEEAMDETKDEEPAIDETTVAEEEDIDETRDDELGILEIEANGAKMEISLETAEEDDGCGELEKMVEDEYRQSGAPEIDASINLPIAAATESIDYASMETEVGNLCGAESLQMAANGVTAEASVVEKVLIGDLDILSSDMAAGEEQNAASKDSAPAALMDEASNNSSFDTNLCENAIEGHNVEVPLVRLEQAMPEAITEIHVTEQPDFDAFRPDTTDSEAMFAQERHEQVDMAVIDDMEIEYLNLRSPEASVDHDHEGENIIESPVIASEIHEDIAHEVQSFEIPVDQEAVAIITSETQDVTAHEVHPFEIPVNQEVVAIIPSETQDVTAHEVQSFEIPVNQEVFAIITSETQDVTAHEVQSFEIPVNQEVFAIITSETQDVTAHEVQSFEIPLNQEVFAIIPSETQDITARGVQSIEMPLNEEIVAIIACGTHDITAREVQSIEMPVNEDVVAIIASDTQDITAHEVQSIKIHVGENVAAMVASETQGLSLQEVQSMLVDGKVAAIAASETHEITALEVQSIEMPANEKVVATLANEVQCHTAPAIAIEESSTFLVKESTEQFDNKPESVQEETEKTYGKSSTNCMKWWEIYDDEVTPAVQKPDSSVLAEIYSELQSNVLAQSVGVETGNKN